MTRARLILLIRGLTLLCVGALLCGSGWLYAGLASVLVGLMMPVFAAAVVNCGSCQTGQVAGSVQVDISGSGNIDGSYVLTKESIEDNDCAAVSSLSGCLWGLTDQSGVCGANLVSFSFFLYEFLGNRRIGVNVCCSFDAGFTWVLKNDWQETYNLTSDPEPDCTAFSAYDIAHLGSGSGGNCSAGCVTNDPGTCLVTSL